VEYCSCQHLLKTALLVRGLDENLEFVVHHNSEKAVLIADYDSEKDEASEGTRRNCDFRGVNSKHTMICVCVCVCVCVCMLVNSPMCVHTPGCWADRGT
jgi:hypothetical protein